MSPRNWGEAESERLHSPSLLGARTDLMDIPPLAALRVFFTVAAIAVPAAAPAYEEAPRPNPSEILMPELKKSNHHAVEEMEVEGRFYRVRMDSDFGVYVIPSLALLRIRANEVAILSQAVVEFERQDQELSEELRGQFSVRADNALDILARPVSTASDLSGQFADKLNETFVGPGAAGGQPTGSIPAVAAAEEDPGTAMHKRNVAAQWGLDVYSSNPKVQDFLAAVARARAGGRISSGAPSFIAPGARQADIEDAAVDSAVAALLKEMSVSDLTAANAALLARMQIGPELSAQFLRHPAYSPRHQARIAHYLDALSGVLNRGSLVEAALSAEDEGVAVAFEQAAIMLLYYHRHVGRLQKLYSGKDVLQAITADNRIVSLFPVDIIYWSEHTERLFDGILNRASQARLSGWEVVVAGDLTPQARKALQQREFLVRERFVQ